MELESQSEGRSTKSTADILSRGAIGAWIKNVEPVEPVDSAIAGDGRGELGEEGVAGHPDGKVNGISDRSS
jgi:hypothetical protein